MRQFLSVSHHSQSATPYRKLQVMLRGKRVLITGVANKHSIAWGIADAVQKEGGRVAVVCQGDRFRRGITKLMDTWKEAHHLLLTCDVTKDKEMEALFEQVGNEFDGRLDMALHSVAYAPSTALRQPFVMTSRSDFSEAHDVSVYSLLALARGAAPLMSPAAVSLISPGGHHDEPGGTAGSGDGGSGCGLGKSAAATVAAVDAPAAGVTAPTGNPQQGGGGSIVSLTFDGADRVYPGYNVMGPCKASLQASVRGLAHELGEFGIRVNSLSAGPVNTLAARGIPNFKDLLRASGNAAPLRRTVAVSEVASMACWLGSDASSAVTGQTLHVDCGSSIMGSTATHNGPGSL